MTSQRPRLPSIARRLGRTVLASALLWSLAVSAAVWLAVRHEMIELLDDALQATAQAMTVPLSQDGPLPARLTHGSASSDRFAWQVVAHGPDGRAQVLLASARAPAQPLRATPSAGLNTVPGWQVFGTTLGREGRMLYVAQSRAERQEASLEVAYSAALTTLAIALLAHLWLRASIAQELAPLQRLSARLAAHDLLAPGATLGAAERAELQPVHAAVDTLAEQLSRRVAHERAFTAHAAHALRTPLAGIDAQLAVALRESPPDLQPRLQRVRSAAGRLQRVVAALLALFRSGVDLQRQALDLPALVARVPVDGLAVQVRPTHPVQADADLLTAALLNLLDNALRHGAREVVVSSPAPDVLRVQDDGPGVPDTQRRALQAALDSQTYEGPMGLGLMLADMVARAHGGALALPPAEGGFVAELRLGPLQPGFIAAAQNREAS